MVRYECIYHDLYTMSKEGGSAGTAIATKVKAAALIRPTRSVLKLSRPIASPPRTTVNCSHERNVRSLAKKTTPEPCMIKTYPSARLGPGVLSGNLAICVSLINLMYRNKIPGWVWRRG